MSMTPQVCRGRPTSGHVRHVATILILLLLSFIAPRVDAADYYVTPTGSGDGSGSSDAHSMSYSALFLKPLKPGDRVSFKSGQVYAGQHWAKSGVTYGRYDEGPN